MIEFNIPNRIQVKQKEHNLRFYEFITSDCQIKCMNEDYFYMSNVSTNIWYLMKFKGLQMIKQLTNPEPLSTDIWIDKLLFITQSKEGQKDYQFKCVSFQADKANEIFEI
jgi:hypothetical protein